jgi:hypothetical protein
MIDVTIFQTALLIVCILGFVAGLLIFSAAEFWAHRWYSRFAFRAFALILSALAALSGAMLVLLK